ncbi:hypothetical protein E5288_WYG012224 [Bos mutus]|uniref:Uncharacterized protein n=1 Tax=Bos mutus TaxID=72004 RepID=A0A6B0RNE2_9CETA|nr:hypothetical protein [Bos mutus]
MDRIIVSRPFRHDNSSNSKNKSEKSEAQRFGKLSPREGGLDVTIPVPQRRNPPKLSEENVYLPLRIGMKFHNIMKVKPRPLKTVLKEKVMVVHTKYASSG